jgi:hypothetical protein
MTLRERRQFGKGQFPIPNSVAWSWELEVDSFSDLLDSEPQLARKGGVAFQAPRRCAEPEHGAPILNTRRKAVGSATISRV